MHDINSQSKEELSSQQMNTLTNQQRIIYDGIIKDKVSTDIKNKNVK